VAVYIDLVIDVGLIAVLGLVEDLAVRLAQLEPESNGFPSRARVGAERTRSAYPVAFVSRRVGREPRAAAGT